MAEERQENRAVSPKAHWFRYELIDQTGERRVGASSAESADMLRRRLEIQGFAVIDVKESVWKRPKGGRRVELGQGYYHYEYDQADGDTENEQGNQRLPVRRYLLRRLARVMGELVCVVIAAALSGIQMRTGLIGRLCLIYLLIRAAILIVLSRTRKLNRGETN